MSRPRRALLVLLSSVALCGCGADYEPVRLEASGIPAEPLGQVVDLEVSLPSLHIFGAKFRGVDLELRLELEQVGFGQLPGRVVLERAWVDQHTSAVEDLSDGRVSVNVTPDSWSTGRIGPLRVEGTSFELLLVGASPDGGWTFSGTSWESQTSLSGSFLGWRRQRFLVSGTDFLSSVGSVSEVAWVKRREIRVRNRLELVSSDSVVRVTGGGVFVLNRLSFDNVQRLDPQRDFSTSWQAGVGVGSNPHDVLVASDERGFLSRYEPPYDDVAIFDPRRGTILATVPLGDLADNRDGTPRADRMRLADGTLFVALQDIDRTFTRYGEARLALIDPDREQIVGSIPLGGKNPGAIEVRRESDGRTRLYVALGGVFPGLLPQELSGGVVVVDAADRRVERMALDDDDAGGNVGALALASESLGYVVISDASFANRVVAFAPDTAKVLRTVRESRDFIPEIEVSSAAVLAVPDRDPFSPRLCLYHISATGDRETSLGCGALELPPFSVEALD